jgi:hypothetical protein
MAASNYINQGGEQVFEQPFTCQNALFYGMILPASKEALQQNLCDKLFNQPMGQPGRFVPAGDFVLLAFCRLQKLISETPPFSTWGAFAEQEIAFWVPVIDTVNEQIFFAFPYIWVDNAYALSMGREIYGFPKQLGQFVIPVSVESADHFQLDTLAIQTFGTNSMGAVLKLLEANKTGSRTGLGSLFDGIFGAGKNLFEMTAALHGLGADASFIKNLFEDLKNGTVPFVFLKQFRDVADGSKTCYQAVIECNCKCTAWHGGGHLDGDYQVQIEHVDSMPLERELGLPTSPIKPELSFWCSFDFFIGEGTEIWKA